MRNLKTLMAAAAVLSLSTTPVLANSAAALSPARAATGVKAVTSPKKASKLAPTIIIGVLATVAIVGGAIVLSDNDDDPDSN
ncbi:MAG: hypothetical protein ABW164_11075 [Sphingobium sp.]